ncbi:MAG: RHS repeat protein [Bdellovibrionaceae bacterium]|nr:RHS repeat protein [Pseudobdellovibrionaceae bacterium]
MNRYLPLLAPLAALMLTWFGPVAAEAVVDMKNANYADSWLDLTVPGTGFDLKVQRYYNSRSNFNGMFGFGWCSDFETALTKTPEGNLKYQECGAGQEILFTKGKGDSKEVEDTVGRILDYVKRSNRTATPAYLDRLKDQLLNSPDTRARWAKQASLVAPEIKKGTIYSADSLEIEQIIWNGEHYVRTVADGTTQKFDSEGRLAVVADKNGNFIKLAWKGELLKEVVDNNARKLSFQHSGKRVTNVMGPTGLKAEFTYDSEDLVSVKNMWKNTYGYKYENHNITRVNFPDGTHKSLTYDHKRDLVLSFTDRAAKNDPVCTESYKYEESKDDPKNHFWSIAVKRCGKEIRNEARFEFWHKSRPDGRKYLYRVLTKSKTDSLDVTYHPDFGRPLSIRKNTITTTFAYYPSGLIKEKSTPNAKMTYDYKNSFNKVSKVVTEFFDDKGKALRKRDTTFQYDGKGNLTYAQNSDGQTVRLTYDVRGRIASIIDQAKKEVLIKYDERTNKPNVITRPKVGSIVVTYKDNEIQKVESKDGPSVAVQVASTFNNLLDIIAPATSELNL